MRRPVLTLLVCGALFAACGSESKSGDQADDPKTTDEPTTTAAPTTTLPPGPTEAEFIEAFDEFVADGVTDGTRDDDTECAAIAMVDAITYERLLDLEVEPDDIAGEEDFTDWPTLPERDEVLAMVDGALECINFAAVMANEIGPALIGDAANIFDEKTIGCYATEVAKAEGFRDILADGFLGDNPDDAEMLEFFAEPLFGCISWGAVVAAGFEEGIGQPLAPESVACINDTVDDDEFTRIVRETLKEGGTFEEAGAEFGQANAVALVECLTDEEFELLSAAAG